MRIKREKNLNLVIRLFKFILIVKMEASVNEIERQSVMEPMLYEESMKKKEKLILKLKTGFPFVYALVHSILVLGLS